jgi:hypothetical protein
LKVAVFGERQQDEADRGSSPLVPAEEDPRKNPAPLAQVPDLIAEGAARYNAGEFWHAHESWEKAWHALRGAGQQDAADFVQALIWVTASFENLQRGKPAGFRAQLAKAVRQLRALAGRGAELGIEDEAGFVAALDQIARAAESAKIGGLGDLPNRPPRLQAR